MAKSGKSKTSRWYGYLKAGARSSPVLKDTRLDTGNTKTFYLFNLERGAILEYSREVVEKKLRELKPAESGFIKKLDAGYEKVRRTFRARGASIRNISRRTATKPAEEMEYAGDSDVITEDAELWAIAE